MIIVRRNSRRVVYSSSWSRREQAEKLGEWQIIALLYLNQRPIYQRYRFSSFAMCKKSGDDIIVEGARIHFTGS